MEDTVKISSGKNLRSIRMKLGLKQYEIVDDDVTTNLISMIENEKTPLSYKVAKIISNNINKISKERNMEIYIVPEDIMSPQRIKAKCKADQYIKELSQHIVNKKYDLDEEYIKTIERFLNKWKIPEKKVEIYELLGDMFYYNNKQEYEYMYLNKALENYHIAPIKKDIYILVRKLIANCISSEKYNEAIKLCNLEFMRKYNIPKKVKASLYYNKALAYKKQNRYDEALIILEQFKYYFSNEYREYITACILECICHVEKGEISIAIDKYERIVEKEDIDIGELSLAFINIIDLFITIDAKEKVIEYVKNLEKTIANIEDDNIYLDRIYYNLADANKYLGNVDLAEQYYINALIEVKKKNKKIKPGKILLALINLYIKTNQTDKILAKNEIFREGIKDIKITNQIRLVLKLVLMNLEQNRKKEANDIINHMLKEES